MSEDSVRALITTGATLGGFLLGRWADKENAFTYALGGSIAGTIWGEIILT